MKDASELTKRLNDDIREHLEERARALLHSPGTTLSARDLAQEAVLRLLNGNRERWESSEHFHGSVMLALQSAYVDYMRRRGALRRGGGKEKVSIDHLVSIGGEPGGECHALSVLELEELLEGVTAERKAIVLARVQTHWTLKEIESNLGVSEYRVRVAIAWFEDRLARWIDRSK